MRKLTLLSILLLLILTSFAQSIVELKSINDKAKNQFITPEALDMLMISLRPYQISQLPDQDSLMLNTFQIITNAYVANNHFKQGLLVYDQYLSYKENMLSKDKSAALNTATNSIGERSRNDEQELVSMQNQLSELKTGNDKLSHRLVLFKSYFSFILISLSVIFAVILAGYGIRTFSLRSRLNQNRNEMKNIHHLALTGRYEEGVRNALQNSITSVQGEIVELKRTLN